MRVGRVGHGQHLGHTSNLCGFRSDRSRIGSEYGDIDGIGLQRQCSADGFGGGGVEFAVQVFGDDQYLAHYSNPFCLSAATSSAASLTITPLPRLAGAA